MIHDGGNTLTVYTNELYPSTIIFDMVSLREHGLEAWEAFCEPENTKKDLEKIYEFFDRDVVQAMHAKYSQMQHLVRQWIKDHKKDQ